MYVISQNLIKAVNKINYPFIYVVYIYFKDINDLKLIDDYIILNLIKYK